MFDYFIFENLSHLICNIEGVCPFTLFPYLSLTLVDSTEPIQPKGLINITYIWNMQWLWPTIYFNISWVFWIALKMNIHHNLNFDLISYCSALCSSVQREYMWSPWNNMVTLWLTPSRTLSILPGQYHTLSYCRQQNTQ